MRISRFFTITSLGQKLFPTHKLEWPRRNCVYVCVCGFFFFVVFVLLCFFFSDVLTYCVMLQDFFMLFLRQLFMMHVCVCVCVCMCVSE